MTQKKTNFADNPGYRVPEFAREILSTLPSVHMFEKPPSFVVLAGPYDRHEMESLLKTTAELSRAGRALAYAYTRSLIHICEDTSRDLLAVDVGALPSSPVQSPAVPALGDSWKVAPYIVPLIPNHVGFIEASGSGACVLMLKPKSFREVYNDQRAEISNLFEILRKKGSALSQLLALTPYQAGHHRKAANQDHADPLEQARRTVLRMAHVQNQADWRSYQAALPGIVARLRDIEIEALSPGELLDRYDVAGNHFHFEIRKGDAIPLPKSASASYLSKGRITKAKGPAQSTATLPDGSFLTVYEPAKKRNRKQRLPLPKDLPNQKPTAEAAPARSFPAKTRAAEVRHRLNLSQKAFSKLLGVPVGTVRRWEAGGALSKPAARLLDLAAKHPEIF